MSYLVVIWVDLGFLSFKCTCKFCFLQEPWMTLFTQFSDYTILLNKNSLIRLLKSLLLEDSCHYNNALPCHNCPQRIFESKRAAVKWLLLVLESWELLMAAINWYLFCSDFWNQEINKFLSNSLKNFVISLDTFAKFSCCFLLNFNIRNIGPWIKKWHFWNTNFNSEPITSNVSI